MTLRTQPVPTPDAGQEWTYTVPGNYLLNVVAVYGELNTDLVAGDVSCADSSGNGSNGFLFPNPNGPVSACLRQPGPMAGSFSVHMEEDTSPPGPSAGMERDGATAMDWSGDFTIEAWFARDDPTHPITVWENFPVAIDTVSVGMQTNERISMGRALDPQPYVTAVNVFPYDGNFHHLAVVFPLAGNWLVYVDGVAVAIASQTIPANRTLCDASDLGLVCSFENGMVGHSSRLAVYPRALGAGEVAAHYAQGVGAGEPGYSLLVLADSPAYYYKFDDGALGIERLATLAITDGSREVGAFPSGAGPLDNIDAQLSWIAQNQAPDAALVAGTVTAPIPSLILPAGYVLESQTAGILPTDQWSNVRILWDDALQQITPGNSPYDYPPGAFLTYKQVGG